MSHPFGTYLGGIRTITDLRDRCRVDEHTGCWHWGLVVSQGSPRVHFVAPDTGKRITTRGRRAALYLKRGRDLRDGMRAIPAAGCKSDDCCNPAHARAASTADVGRYMKQSGKSKTMRKKIAARQVARTTRAKLDPEKAREIRASSETTTALAKRYNVSQYAAWAAKTGKTWREHMPGACVFSSGAST